MTTLLGERCVACRPDSPRVTNQEIADLMPLIPEWTIVEYDGVPTLSALTALRTSGRR